MYSYVSLFQYIAWHRDLQAYPYLDLISDWTTFSNFVPNSSLDDYYRLFYVRPYTRCGVYIVGMLMAFVPLHFGRKDSPLVNVCRTYECNHADRIHMHAATRAFMYIVGLSIIAVLMFVTFTVANYGWNEPENVIFLATNRVSYGFGTRVYCGENSADFQFNIIFPASSSGNHASVSGRIWRNHTVLPRP